MKQAIKKKNNQVGIHIFKFNTSSGDAILIPEADLFLDPCKVLFFAFNLLYLLVNFIGRRNS